MLLESMMKRSGLHDPAWRATVVKMGLAAAVMHLLAALLQTGFHHCDEHFQMLEFVGFKLGISDVESLPWEYGKRLRPWLQPFLYWLIAKVLALDDPFTMAAVFRLFSSAVGWFSTGVLGLCIPTWFPEERRKLALGLLWLFHLVPYVHARTSSENLSQSCFVVALAILVLALRDDGIPWRAAFVAGLLAGAAFVFRYQSSMMTAGLAAWLLVFSRRGVRTVAVLSAGFLVFAAVGVVIDHWGYGEWTLSSWNYLDDQILKKGAARSGSAPWWSYATLWWTQVPGPLGLLVLFPSITACVKFPRHILTWPTVLFLVGHCIIAHKEARYLFPILPLQLLLIALWLPAIFTTRTVLIAAMAVNLAVFARSLFTTRPRETPELAYLHAHPELPRHLVAVGQNPYAVCGLQMRFYWPRDLRVTVVDTIGKLDEAWPAELPAVLVHREVRGVPREDDLPDARCRRLYTTPSLLFGAEWAAHPVVTEAWAGHVREELLVCDRALH